MLTARLPPEPRGKAGLFRSPVSGRSSGVEHNLAKVGVEGSNPFARSSIRFARCAFAVEDPCLRGPAWVPLSDTVQTGLAPGAGK